MRLTFFSVYKMNVYRYERISWLPVLITFIIASVVGGKHLSNPAPAVVPAATASAVLSFASTLAGFSMSFSSLSSDYTSYYRPNVSRYVKIFYTTILQKFEGFPSISWKLFLSAYAGFLLPIVCSINHPSLYLQLFF